jgi:hypothetical protein
MGLRRIAAFMLGLVLLVGAVMLIPLPVRAQQSPRTSVEGVPIVGLTLDGLQLIGAFKLKGFSSEGDELRARGELDVTLQTAEGSLVLHEDVEVAVPLKIVQATCESLHLKMGPFPQLGDADSQHPLQLHVDAGDNVLRHSSLCKIARAVGQGIPADELAALLTNPEGTCPWYEEVGCGIAKAACLMACFPGGGGVSGVGCQNCLQAFGAIGCLSCWQ